MTLIIIFTFVLGTIVGSFLNVVALRYNTGLSIAFDRSQCFSCSKNLSWFEMVPVFSYLFQRGRCRGCRSTISWQYPLVELITGILFAALVIVYPPVNPTAIIMTILYALIWSVLIVIVVYDLRHKIIPDGLAFIFAILSLIALSLNGVTLMGILAGPILFSPFFILWFISRGTWMGLGDAKLAIGIGWFLGLAYGLSAIILAFWIGALVGIALLLLQATMKHGTFYKLALSLGIGERIMKSEIPFAPFLVLGMLIVFFGHIDVIGLSLFL
jgi:leader peptidase (prepilin peptidase)/N-methyltransferase